MYAPKAPEPEWIELFSHDSMSHDLSGWRVSVKSKSGMLGSVTLQPGAYLVLTKDTVAFRLRHPSFAAQLISVSLPALSNSGDDIELRDASGNVIDSLTYLPKWGGASGRSLERRNADGPTTDSLNWGTCTAVDSSTPGSRNSISQTEHDLGISSIKALFINDTLTLAIRINNLGRFASSGATLEIRRDDNHNGIFESSELIQALPLPDISSADSFDTLLTLPSQPIAGFGIEARVAALGDENPSNDTSVLELPPALSTGQLVINEVMYAPKAPEPEWLELLNNGPDTLPLDGCSLSVGSNTDSLPSGSLLPGQFAVLTSQPDSLVQSRPAQLNGVDLRVSKLPTLNNTGGTILLRDARGTLIDSFVFSPHFGGVATPAHSVSLERYAPELPAVNSFQVKSSVDTSGATPGRPNSTRRLDHDLAIDRVEELVTTPADARLLTSVMNLGRDPVDSFGIVLSSLVPRSSLPLATLQVANVLAAGDSLQTALDAALLRFGTDTLEVAINSVDDERRANDTEAVGVLAPVPLHGLLINELMFAPLSSSSQWIELYNATSLPIETGTLLLKVSRTSDQYFHLGSTELSPRGLLVITADSSILNSFPNLNLTTNVLYLSRSTLNLSPTDCGISILNGDSTLIDSVHSTQTWLLINPASGISLERLSLSRSGLDTSNWQPSVATSGGTPGDANSVNDVIPATAEAAIGISPNPFSPDGDGTDDVATLTIKTGTAIEAAVTARIEDINGRVVRTLVTGERAFRTLQLQFDGRCDDGRMLPTGIYVITLDSQDDEGVTHSTRAGIVLAKRTR